MGSYLLGRARSELGGTRWRTGGEVKGKLANGVGSQYSHANFEHGLANITQADAHTSTASSRLNWRPHRFKWTRPFRGKTKSGFCACAITFRTSYTPFIHFMPLYFLGFPYLLILSWFFFFVLPYPLILRFIFPLSFALPCFSFLSPTPVASSLCSPLSISSILTSLLILEMFQRPLSTSFDTVARHPARNLFQLRFRACRLMTRVT